VKPELSQTYPAGLYIVATPIGNLRDITLRALDVLGLCDTILCEDTRVSGKLMSHYGIKAPLLSYHDHNGEFRRPQIMQMLSEGKRLALVSDAGTPLISDPGFKLVRDLQQAGFYVSVLPGASSVLSALCLSGLPTDEFTFAGFLPTKQQALKAQLERFTTSPATIIFFESAKRLTDCLQTMHTVWGNRQIAVVREITKLFEESKRGTPIELYEYYANEGIAKGEVVIVVSPSTAEEDAHDIHALLTTLLQSHSVKDAASIAAEQTGKSRKEIYALALKISQN
jgi:16S rRNA (cytidine1402-2'-O)-methyltransferase